MFMSNFSYCINIRNIAVGISECFKIDCSCIVLNCVFNLFKVMCIYECCCNSIMRKCMFEKIICSTIYCFLCYNMSSVRSKCLDCVCNRCRTWCNRKTCNTAFKCCYSLFKYVLCWVCKSAVDITCVCKVKTCSRMCWVFENIWCCLVNWNCSCICCRIRLFLSYV